MPTLSSQNLELMLLGGFDARLNGRPVAGIYYNKMRALLAYLAVEREQDHNREFLAELLWSDNDPITARGNLRRTLTHLRRALESPTGPTLFSASKHSIRFIPDGYIDTTQFATAAPSCTAAPTQPTCNPCLAQMEYQVGLYRGELMAGFSLPDCPDFEDWLQIQREALQRRALALLEQLSNCHQQIGDYRKSLQFALRHAELEPWDEDAHRRAMHLYALNGQNSAAIHQYEICCRLLKNELGILPNEETRQLAEQIRNGRRSTDTTAGSSAAPQTIPPSVCERRSSERRRASISAAPSECRQVSVLYCELIVAAIDDPDEAMTLLCIPQVRCKEIIRQFSGHIVQAHGGGLLAYFGYPPSP